MIWFNTTRLAQVGADSYTRARFPVFALTEQLMRPSLPPEGYRMADLPRPRLDVPDGAANAETQPGVARLEGVILKPTADQSDERAGPGIH